jgi:hypothetical protein
MRELIDIIEGAREYQILTDVISENGYGRVGETYADGGAEGELGLVKWHEDGGVVVIDSIEAYVPVPMLGIRLLRAVEDFTRLEIDPGMMNEDGKRLWSAYKARRGSG